MTTTNDAGTNVEALIEQREQLRAWIAKLDEVRTDAPSRVAQRVRADYEDRLRRVTEELGEHREQIARDLDAQRAELGAAEERRGAAADALEEMRLRHMIGELDDGAWDETRPRLEGDLADAEAALERTRADVDRLAALAADVADAGAAAEPEPAAPAEAPGSAPEEETAEPLAAAGEPAAETGEESADEDLASWLSEVEAQTNAADTPAADEGAAAEPPAAADDWDPFANEFGGAPASPQTQPGDASDDLPWLDAVEGAAGQGWAAPAEAETDDLEFLKKLEKDAGAGDAPESAPAAPAADLAADDLAFLEELDRAISGGAGRQPATPPPAAPATPAPALELTGGSGEGIGGADPPRKKGESLLCKECGAINEPQAWYCEICGSEL